MQRFLVLLAISALAVLSAAGVASASSNLPDGTVLTATNSGGISLGGVITCNASTLKVNMTNNAAGHGIHGALTAASFTICGSGNAVHVTTLPWTLTTNGSINPWNWSVDGWRMDVTLGSTRCQYAGNPSGGNYDNTAEKWTLAGNLSLQAGSDFLCSFVSPTLNGQYTVSPTLQLS